MIRDAGVYHAHVDCSSRGDDVEDATTVVSRTSSSYGEAAAVEQRVKLLGRRVVRPVEPDVEITDDVDRR